MKKPLEDRKDVENMIQVFYEKVKKDQLIGYLFNEVAKVNWDKHLPIMYDFWENVLFQTGSYTGNPMRAHANLHKKSPLRKFHFDRWKKLFCETVDELFEGEAAELAKQKAISIAALMEIKIIETSHPGTIY